MQSTISNSLKNFIQATESIKFENTKPIEAYGIMGMKSKPWRKIFKNIEQMNKWIELHDAEVHGQRETESIKNETEPTDVKQGDQKIENLIDTINENLVGDIKDWLKQFGSLVLDLDERQQLRYFRNLFADIEQNEG